MSASVVVLSGEGRYRDPWHPFAETSARVAQLLAELGHQVEICGAASSEPRAADLIVVDAGGGKHLPPVAGDSEDRWREFVLDQAAQGVPVLALHAAANTFYDDDRWASILAGRWVPGVSWHPPRGAAQINPAAQHHPIIDQLPASLETVDERYTDLELHDGAVPLLTHTESDTVYPLAWVHETTPYRMVYDGLGHDVEAYGPVRAELLRREVSWLLGKLGE